MKIGVLLKEVPDTESSIQIADDGRSIVQDRIQWVINPYDEIALEEGLRLKEKSGGEVVIVTVGPARAEQSMRKALGLGADRGVRVDVADAFLDPLSTARLLAEAARSESFDVIFAGKLSFDCGWGQVHIGVAEILSIPHVSPVEKCGIAADGSSASVVRATERGKKETIRVSLPAVIGCEKGLNQPRYATLPGMIKARSKPISVLTADKLVPHVKPEMPIERLLPPMERKKGRLITGPAQDSAIELVRLLHEEAGVI